MVVASNESFEPDPAKVAWDAPAGWPKAKIAALQPSQRAKVEMYKSTFKKFPAEIQNAVLAHRLPEQADEVAIKLAWGEPDYFWNTDKSCRALLYVVERTEPHLLTTCEGELDEVMPLLRPISCEKLEATTNRARNDKKAFARLTLEQQLDVLARHRAGWMDAEALKLAFGDRSPRSQGDGPILAPRHPKANRVVAVPHPAVAVSPDPGQPAPRSEPAHSVEPVPRSQPRLEPDLVEPEPGAASEPAVAAVAAVANPAAPAPRRAAVRYETTSVGNWNWTSSCGEVDFDFEIDLGQGYEVRATARPGDGELVRYVTRGKAMRDEQAVRLLGFANGAVEEQVLQLDLGAWPVPSCHGVVANATP